jgi:hypothetical protein
VGVTVAGGEVALGVIAKIAVCVKLGVGKVNGVGEAKLGSVHEAESIARRIITSIRLRIAMSTSNRNVWKGYLDCTVIMGIAKPTPMCCIGAFRRFFGFEEYIILYVLRDPREDLRGAIDNVVIEN